MCTDDIIDAVKISTIFFGYKSSNEDRLLNSQNLNSLFPSKEDQTRSTSVSSSQMYLQDPAMYWKMNKFQVMLPNALKVLQGFLAMSTSFVIGEF